MNELPSWARRGRAQWEHTGERRPAFADTPGPGQESVWDYPRPPRLEPDARRVLVRLGGVVLVDSTRAVRVLETSHPPSFYVPRADVRMDLLVESGPRSRCAWKGEATHWDVRSGERRVSPAAWSYDHPFQEFSAIAGYLAFYPAPFACSVGGERVRPQAGGFYGGWITPELAGPFKGDY